MAHSLCHVNFVGDPPAFRFLLLVVLLPDLTVYAGRPPYLYQEFTIMHALKRTSSLPPYSEPAPKNASTAGGALPSGIKTELHDLSEHPEGVATAPKSGSQNDSLTERLLEQLVQTNTKQTKILDRVSKISEDLLTLSHEKLKLERRQLALSSKASGGSLGRALRIHLLTRFSRLTMLKWPLWRAYKIQKAITLCLWSKFRMSRACFQAKLSCHQ